MKIGGSENKMQFSKLIVPWLERILLAEKIPYKFPEFTFFQNLNLHYIWKMQFWRYLWSKKPDLDIQKQKKEHKKLQQNSCRRPTLSDTVKKEIERLGGIMHKKPPRKYKGLPIPITIQEFCDVEWCKGKHFSHKALGIEDFSFCDEFILGGNSSKFLNENSDAILFGEGEVFVAALMRDTAQDWTDFYVYVIDDNELDEHVYGPFKLSNFLKGCTIKYEE